MSAFGVEESPLYCPYCGERISVLVDTSALEELAADPYIEDCQVCCRPIRLTVTTAADGSIEVHGQHENDV
ncbi:MAG: CPXCG motif-containing cysteine-rich protein [Pseudomonadota bacterium]